MLKIPTRLAALREINGFSSEAESDKLRFHRDGAAFLRDVAKAVGMPNGTYDVRSNKAGPAVSGEVTLHGETLYVQLSESCVGGPGIGILFRSCRGTRDFTGGQNNWTTLRKLAEYPHERERFVEELKRLGGFATA